MNIVDNKSNETFQSPAIWVLCLLKIREKLKKPHENYILFCNPYRITATFEFRKIAKFPTKSIWLGVSVVYSFHENKLILGNNLNLFGTFLTHAMDRGVDSNSPLDYRCFVFKVLSVCHTHFSQSTPRRLVL